MENISSLFGNLSKDWHSRPWWMNLIFYFCLYMTFIYLPFDLFLKPVEGDEETKDLFYSENFLRIFPEARV